jgi:charged multivesicular body protein 1
MVMDKFEQQFEDLDVQSQYMENSMGNTTTLTTPQDEVERLMHQVADEHGLELNMEMGNAPSSLTETAATEKTHESDGLNERLAKLRNG